LVGRTRLAGDRHPCGRLVQAPLPAPKLIEKRRYIVGDDLAMDPRASYPLGILNLRGLIGGANHAAGLRYAAEHHLVFGRGAPRSYLARLIGGRGVAPPQQRIDQAKAALEAANAILLAMPTRRPYHVLQNIVVYERPMRFMDLTRPRTPAAWVADQRDLGALREATEVLAQLWGLMQRPVRAADVFGAGEEIARRSPITASIS
jgi:hypothetical protein